MNTRPRILFYCQHSLGMGHLIRSFSIAAGLANHFDVVFLNGGPLPAGQQPPEKIEIINLPPLGFDSEMQLLSRDNSHTVPQAKRLRRASPLNGERRSLRKISEELAAMGFLNERGKPYNPGEEQHNAEAGAM